MALLLVVFVLCLAFSRHRLYYVGVSVSHFIFKLIFANDLYSWICNESIRGGIGYGWEVREGLVGPGES